MEDECELVSERGYEFFIKNKILSEQDVYTVSKKIKDRDIIFCKTDFIPLLAQVINFINCSFYLVSGRSDYTIPNTFQSFSYILLQSPKVLKWFAVNCVADHEKFIPIPLGIDFHTMFGDIKINPKDQETELFEVKKTFKSLTQTNAHAVTNFQNAMDAPPLRRMFRALAYSCLEKSDCVTWLPKQDRVDFWRSCNNDMFVICPFGNGPDTHRTYEVLVLGRVPIVSSCYFNKELFSDLPVVIIESWNCITKEFLVAQQREILRKYENKEYNFEKITSLYWVNKIKNSTNSISQSE
jgi:hypothetical protein